MLSRGNISQCPCSETPRCKKPFFLDVHEKKDIAIGVLTQFLGSCHQLMASFNGKGMASLLASSRSHSLPDIREKN
jgi:hypothetical protein